MERLKFEECENCKDWNGCISNCMDICGKPLDALKKFNEYMDLYSDVSRFTEEETEFAKQILSEVQTQIDSLPTAYDLNRVKKKLEEESEKSALVTLKAAFKVAIELIEELRE